MSDKVDIAAVRPKAEPRWPAGVAVVAIGALFAGLPTELIFTGSRRLLLAIVLVMIVPTVVTHRVGHHSLNQIPGYILTVS
jgi:hypothetical protein